jgi:hypothetical protein
MATPPERGERLGHETKMRWRVRALGGNGDSEGHLGYENHNVREPDQDRERNCGIETSAYRSRRQRGDQAGRAYYEEESKTNWLLLWLANVCDGIVAAIDRLRGKHRAH